ncbi:unknown function [Klebsiella phage vB_Kpn_K19PH14C4P1]|uniref:Uncharacterized protein n=1 Tax=Klebsiella phage vB_Kpn_K19PH14C4P1 TaxID=3071650 RepID=A0AAV1MJE4_9CAUD|nr:unknown function [Klebsiella phage vB_Kpn_K19PH14C4P1]
MRLHFNKSNGIFSVRREDRSTVVASERNAKLPLIGSVVPLSPRVHLIITRGEFVKAMNKEKPFVNPVVTYWPRVRLFVKWIKEVL